MAVLVHVWIYEIKHFYGSFGSDNLDYFYYFRIKEKRFFFSKKHTIAVLVQLRQFYLMKLILVYVLI